MNVLHCNEFVNGAGFLAQFMAQALSSDPDDEPARRPWISRRARFERPSGRGAVGMLYGTRDVRTAQLLAECSDLRTGLELATLPEGESLLYEQLTELIIRVSDHMLRAHDLLRRKVRTAMGGEVLELINDRAERLEREAEARGLEIGIERGIEQGIEQGIERGIEQGIDDLAAQLRKQGVDDAVIGAAVDALRAGGPGERL